MLHLTKMKRQILDRMLKICIFNDLRLTISYIGFNIKHIINLFNKVLNKILNEEKERGGFQNGRKNEDCSYAWDWENGI